MLFIWHWVYKNNAPAQKRKDEGLDDKKDLYHSLSFIKEALKMKWPQFEEKSMLVTNKKLAKVKKSLKTTLYNAFERKFQ